MVDLKATWYDLQGIVLVTFYLVIDFYSLREKEEHLQYTANAKQVTFTWKRQSATGKREKMAGKQSRGLSCRSRFTYRSLEMHYF